jgi:hypothetical protein
MNASFVLERHHDALRAAKLALLKIQARQTIERTDASARHVEQALAQVAAAITDEMILPAISSSNCKRTGFTDRGAS